MEIRVNDYYEPEHFRALCEDNFNVSRTCESLTYAKERGLDREKVLRILEAGDAAGNCTLQERF